jgi:hypothetical protein
MPLSISLFDLDGLDGLIESSMPWFGLWLFALAFCLVLVVIGQCVSRLRHRSPVEKLLRRRFG